MFLEPQSNTIDWVKLLGIMGGVAGLISLVIHILNFLRDRSKVIVELQWSNQTPRKTKEIEKELWAYITVRNSGRRPVCITFVGLEYPDRDKTINLLTDGLNPISKRIEEGDESLTVKVYQYRGTEQYPSNWNEIRAIASDSRGKWYKSQTGDFKPFWANSTSNN